MEIMIERLRNKAASQLIELDRRADVINRLKAQRDGLRVELIGATAEARALKKQLAEPRRRAEPKSDVRTLLRRWMPHSVYH
jgi:predicted nucleic acid-binding Zn ribbon protein